MDKLERILKNAGFTSIDIERAVVSDQYANKWGINDVDLKHYLRSSTITAYKPV
ncbi:hypothetical protein [Facklamia miroungae]|uniref:hypothetical protein n=1 Tax=Facklamia miroungae TaxID=120956 RepID=UPI001443A658|nr:hypothetical protein [Facklamia miroungae]NKZ29027.1 hypothetical protein [Facklamia miroungae]